MAQGRLAVLALAYGGPSCPEEVEPFLRRVIAPREPSLELVARTVARYQAIGGASPLVPNTLRQAAALEAALAAASTGRSSAGEASADTAVGVLRPRVFVGMRSSPPFLEQALDEALAFDAGRVVVVIMASHQSRHATGSYQHAVTTLLADRDPCDLRFVHPWHTAAGYLDAVTARVREAQAALPENARDGALYLFTAHSLALPAGENDDAYEAGLRATIAGVLERLARGGAAEGEVWRLGFQSRGSRPGVTWLGPDTGDVLREEAAAGRRAVVVVPLGFVAEHLETLYDLDLELAAEAARLGVTMTRAATVQDHPAFIEALTEAVLAEAAGFAGPHGTEPEGTAITASAGMGVTGGAA